MPAIRHFLAHFEGRYLDAIRGQDIRAYTAARQAQGIKPGTINRELNTLSTAINWANHALEWDIVNPVTGNKLPEPEGRLRWLNENEQSALLEAARAIPQAPHLGDFAMLALNTGCRVGELLGLEWSRVDFSANLIYLDTQHTKTRKRRAVPINDAARGALLNRQAFQKGRCPSSPWVFAHENGERIQSVKRSFATACQHAGIKDFHIHDMRHTVGSRLTQSGVPLQWVKEALGHRSIRSTERYAHLAPEQVRKALATLDGSGKREGHADTGNVLPGRTVEGGVDQKWITPLGGLDDDNL